MHSFLTPDADHLSGRGSWRATRWHIPPNQRLERWLAAVTYPKTKPPISGVHADRLGHLWVGETPANEMQPVVWSVFGAAGRIMARVELPATFTPMDIGGDYVLGRVRDADGIEFIQMYELVKSERAPPPQL